MIKKRWIVLGFFGAGLAAAAVFASSTAGRDWLSSFVPKEKPLEVRIEKVTRGDLTRAVSAPGTIEPKTKVQVSAQVLARILALPFREGETVKAGDVLVRLDGRDLAAALESAQAGLRQQQAALLGSEADASQAQLELDRARALFPKDVTKAALEQAEANFKRAAARVAQNQQAIEQARATITRAQKDLENTTIVSPIDGVIVQLNAEVGETVVVGTLNNASSVIMEIADLSTMLMKARVDETNIAPVKAGQRAVIITNAYRDRTFTGTVERVGLKKMIDTDRTNYFEVEIVVDRPEGLTLASGLTANADIQVQTFAGAVRVPSQAIVDRRQDELPKELIENSTLVNRSKVTARVVFVYEDGQAKPRAVLSGASDLTNTIVVDGLKEGDQIITGPFRVLGELRDGLKVVEEGTKDEKGDPIGRRVGGSSGSGLPMGGPRRGGGF